jgi:ABC-type siderophore export system fused ATPase/permease subunit
MQITIGAIIVVAAIFAVIFQSLTLFVVTFVSLAIAIVVLVILKERYFKSEEFLKVKEEIQDVVNEHNEISDYVQEIRERGKFTVGRSSTGMHAHLAE